MNPPTGLDTHVRDALAQRLIAVLRTGAAGSVACLRGSLAAGRADCYSDIDLRWEMPDHLFADALERLPSVLSAVGPIDSLRSDPEFQNSAKRRLLFVQMKDVPLFWRVDLEVVAFSIRDQPDYDLQNPAARGNNWSLTHSALANATGAIKCMLRGRPADAEGLLTRAFQRIGVKPPAISLPGSILDLVRQVTAMDPAQAGLAGRIEDLYAATWGGTV